MQVEGVSVRPQEQLWTIYFGVHAVMRVLIRIGFDFSSRFAVLFKITGGTLWGSGGLLPFTPLKMCNKEKSFSVKLCKRGSDLRLFEGVGLSPSTPRYPAECSTALIGHPETVFKCVNLLSLSKTGKSRRSSAIENLEPPAYPVSLKNTIFK